MKTAHLGRRLGDWLGIVPEDDVPTATSADYFDLDQLDRLDHTVPVEAPPAVIPSPAPRLDTIATPESPAPSPVWSSRPNPEPATNVRSFRDVVNQRRAEAQQRAAYSQAPPPRW